MADDAFAILEQQLRDWRLPSLVDDIWSYLKEGLSAPEALLRLQDTPAWKQRFAGNEARVKAGLPPLSPAEYLATEDALIQVMRQRGLPPGYYDDTSDLAEFIGNGVSPAELDERLAIRERVFTQGEMSGVAQYMRERFGLSTGDVVAYFTDPQRALPLLQKQVQAAEIGAAARRAKFGEVNRDTALRLAELGVSEEQAIATFSQLAALEALTRQLPGQRGVTVSRETLVQAGFEGDAEAQRQVERARGARTAEFEGRGGFAETREGFAGLGTAS